MPGAWSGGGALIGATWVSGEAASEMGREAQTELDRAEGKGQAIREPQPYFLLVPLPLQWRGICSDVLLTPGSWEIALVAQEADTQGVKQGSELWTGSLEKKRSLREDQNLGVLVRVHPACVLSLSWEICFVHDMPWSRIKRGQPRHAQPACRPQGTRLHGQDWRSATIQILPHFKMPLVHS